MEMTMTNKEIINFCTGLMEIQESEKKYFEETGKKLLQGRIKIGYAISKNILEFKNALKAYNEVLESIIEEFRDSKKEEKAVEEEQELAKKENRVPRNLGVIMRQGKTKEEYLRKIKELQEIETELNIATIKFDVLDGLELDSTEIGKMIFMITE